MSQTDGWAAEARRGPRRTFVGVLVVEVITVIGLWALSRYFGA